MSKCKTCGATLSKKVDPEYHALVAKVSHATDLVYCTEGALEQHNSDLPAQENIIKWATEAITRLSGKIDTIALGESPKLSTIRKLRSLACELEREADLLQEAKVTKADILKDVREAKQELKAGKKDLAHAEKQLKDWESNA